MAQYADGDGRTWYATQASEPESWKGQSVRKGDWKAVDGVGKPMVLERDWFLANCRQVFPRAADWEADRDGRTEGQPRVA